MQSLVKLNKTKEKEMFKGFIIFTAVGGLLGAAVVGSICYHESKKVDDMLSGVPVVMDYQFMPDLNDCKKRGNVSVQDCKDMFNIESLV